MKNIIKEELINLLIESCKTDVELKKRCDEIIREKQIKIMLNPKVYVAKTKDVKNDRYYLNCKLFLPIGINQSKELKVYIGKLSDFPNGTKDVDAYKLGQDMMRKRIKQYLEEKK